MNGEELEVKKKKENEEEEQSEGSCVACHY